MAEPMYQLSFHEILTKVNNAKDKKKKIEVLNKLRRIDDYYKKLFKEIHHKK